MSANVGGGLDLDAGELEPEAMWDGEGITLEINQSFRRLELSLGRDGGCGGPWG